MNLILLNHFDWKIKKIQLNQHFQIYRLLPDSNLTVNFLIYHFDWKRTGKFYLLLQIFRQ